MATQNDVLIIGAGLAGLTAAWQASQAGKRVRLIAKGWGATHWHSGCIDVLGYYPVDTEEAVSALGEQVAALTAVSPQHPYALAGMEQIEAALKAVQTLCAEANYPLLGSLDKNWLLPSAVGTFRPTCLAPEMMTAGDLTSKAPMLLVGFEQITDFYPNVAAANLSEQGILARHVMLNLPTLAQRNFTTNVILARMLEQPDFQAELVQALKPHLGDAERIGFPAMLGIRQATAVRQDLERQLGRPVFEIPGLPPSVAGMRLHFILKAAIEANGGTVYDGMEAIGAEKEDGRVTAVFSETSSRPRAHRYQNYVLATGGIMGGGIVTNHAGEAREVVFDLPVKAPENRIDWFRREFLHPQGHPIYQAGVTVNEQMQPVNHGAQPLYENVYVAGTTLAHCEAIRERSFEGIALITGYVAGQKVAA